MYLYDLVFKIDRCKPTAFHSFPDTWYLLTASNKINIIKADKVKSIPQRLAQLKQTLGTFASFHVFSYLRKVKRKFNYRKNKRD